MKTFFSRTSVWVVAIVLWCAAAGYLAGRIWMTRWHPPTGQVVSHTWYPSPWDEGNKAAFAASGWFVVIGLPLGVIIGVLAGWFSRQREVATLGAAMIGSTAAAAVMYRYGIHVSPPDPSVAARSASDGTVLVGSLARPGWPVLAVIPASAVAMMAGIYLLAGRSSK